GASADEGYCIAEDPATGDLYIGGRTLGMGQNSVAGFISKFSAAGAHQWTRVIGNAFDVVGIVPAGGRFAALLRAQDIAGGYGGYDELLVFFNGMGDLLGSRLFGTAGSDYPVSLSAMPWGGLLVTSLSSGPAAIRAVLTDPMGNGGCSGTNVQVAWAPYTPTVFTHSSTQQTGHSVFSWITPQPQPSLSRQFVCCTYPVEASFDVQPGNALGHLFINSSTGGGTALWSIEGASYTGDTVFHSFSAPGIYTACLTLQGVCAQDTDCMDIAVATTGVSEPEPPSLLLLWPQPAGSVLHVRAAAPVRAAQVLDATGREVRRVAAPGGTSLLLDVGDLGRGLFLLRAWTDAGTVQRSFIKE
ncbi:MAG: hypothetical protein ACK4L7_10835, partial [Flavobacteriales bacterium]